MKIYLISNNLMQLHRIIINPIFMPEKKMITKLLSEYPANTILCLERWNLSAILASNYQEDGYEKIALPHPLVRTIIREKVQ